MKDLNPFDFMNAASFTKEDLIRNSDQPEHTVKQYNAYVINRGFVNFDDCILHANEMNMRHGLFHEAQFDYYKAVLRKRKRFSKWPKADKDKDLDAIQHVYDCNRTVAKQYFKCLSKDQIKTVHEKMNIGG
ncbi:MAG: DNA polymerase clamp loader subunit A [Methylophagaceae bacterium]|jgi:hypothetical protein|tara:strand:+ start:668 stop:1060 length:393 start_codon:yes stop_codon:yes gene_type:complete